MNVVVIGGQASGVGKTSVICGLIAAMPERRWTAIKITQCNHGTMQCSRDSNSKECDCELHGASIAISVEHDRTASSDSSRYLAAGAVRSLWMRTLPGHLGEALPRLEEEIAGAENVVIESNSVMEFLSPDIYALIVSPNVTDVKASARRYLSRANVVLVAEPATGTAAQPWFEAQLDGASGAERFAITGPQFASPEFVAYVRQRLDNYSPQM